MKKALKLFLMYIVYSIIGILIGTALYSLYVTVLNYVEGQSFVLFNFELIKSSFFYICACLVFYISSVVAYTRIRSKGGIAQLAVFLLVSAISWGLVFPSILHFGDIYLQKNFSEKEYLSAGYFRKSGDKVYYQFESLENKESVSVVEIDTTQEGQVSLETISHDSDLPLASQASPYKDILISDNFKNKSGYKSFINYHLLIGMALQAFSKSWTYWLGFLSIGLLLSSIYGLSNLFNWKLLNGCNVMLVTLAVLAMNTAFYQGVFEGFKSLKIWKLGFIKSFGNYVDEPVLVIINVFFAVIFIITGIVRFAVSHKKMKKGEE